MRYMVELLVTISPVVIQGVLAAVFIKAPFLNSLNKPIDRGILLADGRPCFGANKTWKGLFASVFFYGFSIALFYHLYFYSPFLREYSLVDYRAIPSLKAAFLWGSLQGLGYRLFELPNSFLKRRMNISPGSTKRGLPGVAFLVLDQVDSLFGIFLFMSIYHIPSLLEMVSLFVIGGIAHWLLHRLFIVLRLKSTAAQNIS